jgi:hypothetical protein
MNTKEFAAVDFSEGNSTRVHNLGFRVAAITLTAGAVITLASLLPASAQTTHKATTKHHARHHSVSRSARPVYIHEVSSTWHYPYAQQTAYNGPSYSSVSAGSASSSMSSRASSGAMAHFTGSADLPSSATPIMNRIAALLQASQARTASRLPSGARASYTAAASAFHQALMAGRMSASGSAPANGALVSSLQVTDDIQTLRMAAQQSHGRQAGALTQIASLYATGAKEFFTGELRLALLGTGGARGTAIAISGSGASSERRSGTASSSELPKAPGYPNEGHGGGGGVIQPDGTVGPDPNQGLPGTPLPTAPLGNIPPIVTAPIGPFYDGGVIIPNTPVITGPLVPGAPTNVPTAPVVPPVGPTVP